MSTSIVKKKKYKPEWLRKFKGFENYTEEEADKELEKLELLASIMAQHLQNINKCKT
ncbi:hypothetical protein [Lacinutrix chionoecetis]